MDTGKRIECTGVDPYNLSDSHDVAVTVTTCVGQATASGPKVALRIRERRNCKKEVVAVDMGGGKSSSNVSKNLSPTITCTHGGEPVIGTIDASIYKKNGFQDNTKYIIERRRKGIMESIDNIAKLREAVEEGVDVEALFKSLKGMLEVVDAGIMSIEEAMTACDDVISQIKNKNIKGQPMKKEEINVVVGDNPEVEEEEVCVVRRLTPTETARLQGFPDDYTKIDGKETADAPQFKSHGNSWATPCANFISTRVEMELRRLGHEGTIRYATCCSGIEAHSIAVRNLDWRSVFFSEIEPFPCRVLASHYPQTPNLGDMTQIHYDAEKGCITNSHKEGEEYSLPSCFKEAPIQEIPFIVGDLEVFSGGTPCQSISIAGKREGMAEGSGTRSSLAFHYQRIIDESRPAFTIWENVPGAFSSNGGADFIWFVNRCAESGYAMAWRVLDAQYTMTEEFPRAVPQRRRRIWLVGYRENDWRIPARIVFELNKDLTDNPPQRIPGIGFKTVNDAAEAENLRAEAKRQLEEGNKKDEGLFDLFASTQRDGEKMLKVSKVIPFGEMPNEMDFSKIPMVSIYEFAKKVGEPGFVGDVFRKDKKTAMDEFKKSKYYHDGWEWDDNKEADAYLAELRNKEAKGELQWEGAEKVSPSILENIGNAGILANGRICTITCHEWTAGIQLSPKTFSAWEEFVKHKEWLKANGLLPEAYDETVCGLSDVLEDDPDEKYNLSWRACFGILKRAETRGKELPEALEIALVSTIRENAGIVKWVALNGRDTKKKETDLSEKESAILCFERFISPVAKFEEVEAVPPKKKEDDEVDEDADEEALEFESQNNLDDGESEEAYWNDDKRREADRIRGIKPEMPELPNGVINTSGGETAATLIASGDAAVGTTQDANVIALKK